MGPCSPLPRGNGKKITTLKCLVCLQICSSWEELSPRPIHVASTASNGSMVALLQPWKWSGRNPAMGEMETDARLKEVPCSA